MCTSASSSVFGPSRSAIALSAHTCSSGSLTPGNRVLKWFGMEEDEEVEGEEVVAWWADDVTSPRPGRKDRVGGKRGGFLLAALTALFAALTTKPGVQRCCTWGSGKGAEGWKQERKRAFQMRLGVGGTKRRGWE